VGSITNALERALGKRGYMQTSIVHTVSAQEDGNSTIRATISQIEAATMWRAKGKWQDIHPGKEVAGYFVAKCDVSEVPLEETHNGLYVFQKCREGHGYGIYSSDYTQDFSGVLHHDALVAHLGFAEHGDHSGAMHSLSREWDEEEEEKKSILLDNTGTVGKHVCTWLSLSEKRTTTRTKVYNKIVSNFEAGEIREPVGGHLADYADCPNAHLRRTFEHPDVQGRGCTRIEISVYAPPLGELSSKKAEDYIGEVLQQVSAEDEEDGVFVVQPPSKQWENLAKKLDRCLVFADRPQRRIFVGWYAHTITGRISGIHIVPKPAKVRDPEKWEKAILWAAGDFGFRNCPIFRQTKKEWRLALYAATRKARTQAQFSPQAKSRHSSTRTEATWPRFFRQQTQSLGNGETKNATQSATNLQNTGYKKWKKSQETAKYPHFRRETEYIFLENSGVRANASTGDETFGETQGFDERKSPTCESTSRWRTR